MVENILIIGWRLVDLEKVEVECWRVKMEIVACW
jgi:hypothetical protein